MKIVLPPPLTNQLPESTWLQDFLLLLKNNLQVTWNRFRQHPVRSSLGIVLGKAMGLKHDTLNILASGALLHDIGIVKLPKELLSKRKAFSPEEIEIFKTHTEEGYKLLKSREFITLITAHIAYQHHEFINGSGYPRGLSDKIHPLAKIVGLVDYFDNLVNDGPGHTRIDPNEAVEILMGMSGKIFPDELVKAFLDHVEVYPTGCTVELNTGNKGVVVSQNRSLPSRPVVRIFADKESTNNDLTIDLVKHLTVFIQKILG